MRLTGKQIADTFRRSEATVSAILASAGLTDPKPYKPDRGKQSPVEGKPTAMRVNPLVFAESMLRDFDRDTMRYQGRVRHLDDIMQMANAEAAKQDIPPLLYSERWKPAA
ncbi:hypothetical protein [Tautonia plasticadhaerens]|nr:hypothetical protein [Tautonia plasticadhaerens]